MQKCYSSEFCTRKTQISKVFLLNLQELLNVDLIPPKMQTKNLLSILMVPLEKLAKSDSNIQ